MAGLETTDRGSLSDLPATPQIPQNIGKVDVGAIYDRVAQALQISHAIANEPLTTAQNAAQAGTAIAQAGAQRQVLPSQTAATIAENQAASQQAPIKTRLLSTQTNRLTNTEQSDTAAKNAKNNEDKLQSDLNSIYANAGIKYGPEQADAVGKAKSNLIHKINTTPGGLYNEPVVGPNGVPIGSVIGYMGPNGPEVHAMPIPTMMARQGSSFSAPKLIGAGKPNPQTGEPMTDQYQIDELNPFGLIVKSFVREVPHGAPAPYGPDQGSGVGANAPSAPVDSPTAPAASSPATTTSPSSLLSAPAAGSNKPLASPSQDRAPAFQNRTLATSTVPIPLPPGINPNSEAAVNYRIKTQERLDKQKSDDLATLTARAGTIGSTQASLATLRDDLNSEQDSLLGSGPGVGRIPFRPTVNEVSGDKANFVQQTIGKLKGVGRITDNELKFAIGNFPAADMQPEVQNKRYDFWLNLANAAQHRNEYATELVNQGYDLPTADKLAIQKFPDITAAKKTVDNAGAKTQPDFGAFGADSSAAQPQTGAATTPAVSQAAPSVPNTPITEAVGVTADQARTMPPGVNYYIKGHPVGPNGQPIVFTNGTQPQGAAAPTQ